jgi:N-acetylglucosaminyl-diphospho-decaprenol L-rhamnosyltransferase
VLLGYARIAMKLLAIVPNYRTAEMTAEMVGRLLPELAHVGAHRVFIVDNDSGDGSVERLRAEVTAKQWGDRVEVIAAPQNRGYGYAVNHGVEQSRKLPAPPEYIYVLNSDAYPDPGSLQAMVRVLDTHADVGIAGSRIHGPAGDTQATAFRFPSVSSEFEAMATFGPISRLLSRFVVSPPEPPASCEVDWIPGTSMLIRRRAFEQIEGFDEGFFLYYEETDICRRARAAGWKTFYVANAGITHIGSVSTGIGDQARRMPGYWFASRHRYFIKSHGRSYATLCDAAWVVGFAVGKAKRLARRSPETQRPHMLTDFIRNSVRDLLGARLPDSQPKPTNGTPAVDARPSDELGLGEILAEDFATHDSSFVEPGFWAVAVHRLGTRAARVGPAALRAPLDLAYKVLSTGVDHTWGIHLPRDTQLGRRVRIWHVGSMFLNARSIGNDVQIRHDTTFGPVRGVAAARPEDLPVIEDSADIGSGVCVLGGVTVGRGAVVGANSVVLKPVPVRASVLGVPARIIPG